MTIAAEVEVRNLTKSFALPEGRSLRLFDNFSASFKANTITCIVGPSGCGKTTLLNVIAGLVAPDEGSVHRSGGGQDGPPLSYMFQEDRLLPWRNTIKNTLLGVEIIAKSEPAVAVEQARSLLRTLGLSGFEYAYPQELSAGMRQRVAFARTLIVRPTLLLLDEPFSNIDYEVRLKLENILLGLFRGRETTAIVVTHDLEEAIVLGQHIFVLGGSPTCLVESIEVNKPLAERDALQMRQSQEFGRYLGQLADHILKNQV
jgi:NitT/TauT family transport system ATP-binding protein